MTTDNNGVLNMKFHKLFHQGVADEQEIVSK